MARRNFSNVIRVICLRCRGGSWHDKSMGNYKCTACGCQSWEAESHDEEF